MRSGKLGLIRGGKSLSASILLSLRGLSQACAPLFSRNSARLVALVLLGAVLTWTAARTVAHDGDDSGQSLLSLIANRSPGERGPGALSETKVPYHRVASASHRHGTPPPHQRVLSQVRHHEPVLPGSMPFRLADPIARAALPIITTDAPTGFVDPLTGPSELASPVALLSAPIIAASVPETDTWLMLIIGVGMIGADSRRRRARLSQTFCKIASLPAYP